MTAQQPKTEVVSPCDGLRKTADDETLLCAESAYASVLHVDLEGETHRWAGACSQHHMLYDCGGFETTDGPVSPPEAVPLTLRFYRGVEKIGDQSATLATIQAAAKAHGDTPLNRLLPNAGKIVSAEVWVGKKLLGRSQSWNEVLGRVTRAVVKARRR